ncbi:WNT1-inducible-signaling pathway protein 2-like [Sphaeramia orbicularis]|uniref:WNT1-inducible-signaling pathway protein 2-like n=1 Tax=Sphaeramia orbicularis TaxID=375764 RepID=UPI00117C251F|nr:WNT1-inducible-signaling pathway protein 2-like [Sphaeramia orbicularis]
MKRMRMDRVRLVCSMLWIITQVSSQPCSDPCRCPPVVLRCPPGVLPVLDGCRCCQVCARQEGESCSAHLPCDAHRGLQCDYSATYPGGPGQCVGQNQLGCELNGRRLEEGQVFQPSCAQLCHCLGGGVTCVPLCTDDLKPPPAERCPHPQLLRPPGRCCKEWVCDGLDNSISTGQPAELAPQDQGPGSRPVPACVEWSTDWSPCSHSCGPGVSTRVSNRNRFCRPQTQTRLCQVRPCQSLMLPGLGLCETGFSSLVPVQLEHQGCWSIRPYWPRFCAPSCPDGHCCSPALTRTVAMAFLCPQRRLVQYQVMVIESCSCSVSNCRPLSRSTVLPWL